jgi:VWFA-related protein
MLAPEERKYERELSDVGVAKRSQRHSELPRHASPEPTPGAGGDSILLLWRDQIALRTSIMKPILTFAAMAAAALPLFGQQKLVESIEVRVVNIDVVVTDRTGNPVTGLTKDDFELFENGRPQTITNLYEVKPESAAPATAIATPGAQQAEAPLLPAEMRIRRFIIFIDNFSLHPFKRNQIFKSLNKFIDEQMRPEDEAEIVVWSQSLKIITPFTTDKKALKSGIAQLSERVNAGMSIDNEADQVKRHCQELLDMARDGKMLTMPQAYDQCRSTVSAHADRVWMISKTLLEAMRLTMTTLSGLEGKKVMVFAGAHLPEQPGLELYMYMTQLFGPFIKNIQMQGFNSDRSQTFSIERLARQANADGVTMYMIDAADSRDTTSAEQSRMTETDESFTKFSNTAMAYLTLARVTGGISLTNTSNFDVAFNTVARDLNSYYSLGYKPGDDRPGDHRVVVKTKNAAYSVRSRTTYAPKTAEEQINDRVVANIYHAGMRSEWPIELRTGKPAPNGERFDIPIEISLPPTVTLLPQGDELVGGFNVYIAVGSDNGAMSKVTRSEQPIRIPKSAEAELRRKPMTFTATIIVRAGDSTLSVAAVDQISNAAGLARTRIAAR